MSLSNFATLRTDLCEIPLRDEAVEMGVHSMHVLVSGPGGGNPEVVLYFPDTVAGRGARRRLAAELNLPDPDVDPE